MTREKDGGREMKTKRKYGKIKIKNAHNKKGE